MHMCLGENCTKKITYRFALCTDCENKYGRSPYHWPKWLRFLWNDIQRERRKNRKIKKHEIPFSKLSDNEKMKIDGDFIINEE